MINLVKKLLGHKLKCDDCEKEDETVQDTFCPFAADINNEEVQANLCPDCYHERCMDI
jgi:hypothetical protein